MNKLPRLDLAPKLTRPLQLWNPFDCLRLLYWVFFFPQAISWYEEYFVKEVPPRKIGWREKIKNSKYLRLILQAILAILGVNVIVYFFLVWFGLSIDWISIAICTSNSVAVCMIFCMFGRVAAGVAAGVTACVACVAYGRVGDAYFILSVTGLVIIVFSNVDNLARRMSFFMAYSMINRKVDSLATSMSQSLDISSVTSSMAFCLISGVAIGVASGITIHLISPVAWSITLIIAIVGGIFRLESWVQGTLLGRLKIFPRNTFLPIPTLHNQLYQCLKDDWSIGIHNLNQFMCYSLQYIPVVKALNKAMSEIPTTDLIPKVVELIQSSNGWKLIYISSSLLPEALKVYFMKRFMLIPSRLCDKKISKSNMIIHINTLVRAIAAGFWYWYNKDATNSIEAFHKIRSLPYGEELFELAQALLFTERVKSVSDIASLAKNEKLTILNQLDKSKLDLIFRLPTWEALIQFEKVAIETQTVINSHSPTMRSLSLNRALGELDDLLNRIEEIPEAEREIIKETANRWQGILLAKAKEIGQVTISAPIVNPYVLGDPVEGDGFVGREEILRRLEELWAQSDKPPSVVLYGHRRMGKTSILRNIHGKLSASIHVAYINLLVLGDAPARMGDVLLAIADSIVSALQFKTTNIPQIIPEDFKKFPERIFGQFLRSVRQNLGNARLIIALDEFEQLEIWMRKKRIPRDFFKVLRSFIQMDSHIAFAFAGLHSLEEMSADYTEPFFASVIPLKVGFLSKTAVFKLLANPSKEFPLDYATEASQRIWKLSSGQPYLVQLIGHRLVSRFNDLTFEQGKEPGIQITEADVEAVINSPEFYQMSRYYFTGVWGQAKQGAKQQQRILRVLSQYPEGISEIELQTVTNLNPRPLNNALQTLERHDVIVKQDDRWRITVELIRRWVKEKCQEE